MTSRPAAGGGRWVDVSPERLGRWLSGFRERHGPLTATADTTVVRFRADDGSLAECHPPFPPMPASVSGQSPDELAAALVEHAARPREVGVLLVRLGGYAVGVFAGTDLVASKVGSRPVHGRHAAGGQSQRRFQRRREGEIRAATRAAADTASRVLLPHLGSLEAVALGGDRRAVAALRADRRLEPVFALARGRFLDVPDPKLAVLRRSPELFRAVRVRLIETAGPAGAASADVP